MLFFPFYLIFTRIKLTRWRFILLTTAVILVSGSVQLLFVGLTENLDLGGSYHSYTANQIGKSFWDNYWKITFEQMVLGIMMWIYYKKVKRYQLILRGKECNKLRFIWVLCLFDMMCIPVNFVLGVWRGYEFLYLARIVLWCTIFYLFERSQPERFRIYINQGFMILLVAWIVFRFWNMWESAGLMPYIFEPLL